MSVTAMASAARALLANALFSSTCTRKEAANNWAVAATFPCHVEETPPEAGVPIDYDGGTGYGYTVWLPVTQAIAVTDRIEVAGSDPPVLKVQRVHPVGSLDGAQRVDCVVL